MSRSPCFEGWDERILWGRQAKAETCTDTNLGQIQLATDTTNSSILIPITLSTGTLTWPPHCLLPRSGMISLSHVSVRHTLDIRTVRLTSNILPII